MGSTVVVDETGRQEAAVLPLSRLTDAVSLVEGCRHAADQEEVADPEFPHQPQVRAVVGAVISERNLTTKPTDDVSQQDTSSSRSPLSLGQRRPQGSFPPMKPR